MTDQLDFTEENRPTLPGSLNVLTILTFIGSALGLIFIAATPWLMNFSKSMMDKAVASGAEIPEKQLEEMRKGRAAIELFEANMTPIIITGVLGCILCIVGAVMMRKQKKDGYWVYIAGELLPIIAGFVLMGTAQYTGVTSVITSLILPVIFVILYTVNRKHLVY